MKDKSERKRDKLEKRKKIGHPPPDDDEDGNEITQTEAIEPSGKHHKDEGALGGHLIDLAGGGKGIVLGARIPKDYFVAKGYGETDEGGGNDPWETGSYDLALEMAGIEDFNVVTYTSCLPPEARQVSLQAAKSCFHHGSVLETIMAVMHGQNGDRLSAGVGQAMVRRKSDGFVVGGYAAEYKGHAKTDAVRDILEGDLEHIFDRRFDEDGYELFDRKFHIVEHEVTKGYGTVLAAICFVNFILPVVQVIDETAPGSKVKKQKASHYHE